MVRCRVISCKSDSEKKIAGVSFHAFPDDPDLRKKWIKATGRKDWTPTKYCKICSNHFLEKILIKKKKKTVLHSDAVPNAIQVFESDNSIISKSASVSLTQEPKKSIKISTPEESADPVPSTSSIANFQDDAKIKTIRRKLHLPEEEDTPRKKNLKPDLKKKTEAVETDSAADVIAVCEIAEKVFKQNLTQLGSKLLERNNLLLQLINQCLRQCIGKELFIEHGVSYDHSNLNDHKILLIKAITMKYLKIRIYKFTKQLSELKEKVRNKCSHN